MWLGTFSQYGIFILLLLHWLETLDSSLLLPSVLILVLSPNVILFSCWSVSFFIKPITVTNLHSIQRDYSTALIHSKGGWMGGDIISENSSWESYIIALGKNLKTSTKMYADHCS